MSFDRRPGTSFGATLEGPPMEKKKKKIVKKVKSPVKKFTEKVSPIKYLDKNIQVDEENMDDGQTINDLIQKTNIDRQELSDHGSTDEEWDEEGDHEEAIEKEIDEESKEDKEEKKVEECQEVEDSDKSENKEENMEQFYEEEGEQEETSEEASEEEAKVANETMTV